MTSNKPCRLAIVVTGTWLGILAATASAQSGPEVWKAYRFVPDALLEQDLAADSEWTLSIDDGPSRSIKVPGGGWNSDRQEPPIPGHEAKDHVVYQRKLTIPERAKGKVVKLHFGGCNYGAEVYLDDRKLAEHHGPLTPFAADLTGVAQAGKSYTLKVKAFTRFHYGRPPIVPVPFDFTPGVSPVHAGNTKFAYGLIGYVRLAVYPEVYVADVFVRPSMSKRTLSYDVWVSNGGKTARSVGLSAELLPWKGARPVYPKLPEQTLTVAAGQTAKVTVEGIAWDLGPTSYWWPNIPFDKDYQPALHWLDLRLTEAGQPLHGRKQRFGFVEHAEGPFYYTVNGVRYTSFGDSNSYGQVGEYDCWTETLCFMPPHGDVQGCPETWRRYQRIGFNSMRLSTSVPTPYMLDTADEAGVLLICEGGSWGNGTSVFHPEHFPVQLRETVRAARGHPSVAQYSLANESVPAGNDTPLRALIDAALEEDVTRPLVFEMNSRRGVGRLDGMKQGHAYKMQHYDPVEKGGDCIRGMGECCWATNGMGPFALTAIQLRINDYAHFAPWSWLNFWPNFLEGMDARRHPWQADCNPDRVDGKDGWGSPIVDAVQRALHPYLVFDVDLARQVRLPLQRPFDGGFAWPAVAPELQSGADVERSVQLFNGSLAKRKFELKWSLHWDKADGAAVADGTTGPLEIEAGFSAVRKVAFRVPAPGRPQRTLFLVLQSVADGQPRYREDRICFTVREE